MTATPIQPSSGVTPVRQSPDATTSTVGDRVVLYHRRSNAAVVLNPTGSWMWQQLATPRAAADLVGMLQQRFPALSPEDAARDVHAFLTELGQHAMLA